VQSASATGRVVGSIVADATVPPPASAPGLSTAKMESARREKPFSLLSPYVMKLVSCGMMFATPGTVTLPFDR